MKTKTNYLTPEVTCIFLEVEQCIASSSPEAGDNGFKMNDFIDGGEL